MKEPLVIEEIIELLGTGNLIAIGIFFLLWLVFEIVNDHTDLRHKSLSGLMALKRREWMLAMADRDLRMIDTSILANLQQGAAFFASASILAIGGCFALLGSADVVLEIYKDLPVSGNFSRSIFEIKVLGLALICIYAFFKFGWSFRLFNYCGILMGAVRMVDHAPLEERREQSLVAADMNIIASKHFTAGLRAIFFSLGYLGWFVSPTVLIVTTSFVILVLIRRQYFSKARSILSETSHI